jgi:hypothetical protein
MGDHPKPFKRHANAKAFGANDCTMNRGPYGDGKPLRARQPLAFSMQAQTGAAMLSVPSAAVTAGASKGHAQGMQFPQSHKPPANAAAYSRYP